MQFGNLYQGGYQGGYQGYVQPNQTYVQQQPQQPQQPQYAFTHGAMPTYTQPTYPQNAYGAVPSPAAPVPKEKPPPQRVAPQPVEHPIKVERVATASRKEPPRQAPTSTEAQTDAVFVREKEEYERKCQDLLNANGNLISENQDLKETIGQLNEDLESARRSLESAQAELVALSTKRRGPPTARVNSNRHNSSNSSTARQKIRPAEHTTPFTGVKDSSVQKASLGMKVREVADHHGGVRLKVVDVSTGGNADRAGVRKNDIILTVGGISAPTKTTMLKIVHATCVGDILPLQVEGEDHSHRDIKMQLDLF